jgi:hypothetical protein
MLTYFVIRLRLRKPLTLGLIGAIAGITFLWTNDFGLPTLIFLLICALLLAKSQGGLTPALILLILGSAIFSASASLAILTKGHGLDLLRYNFADVRLDQYWYFGPWTEDSRILSIEDIGFKLLYDFGWWSLTIVVFFARNIFRPSIERWLVLLIGLILFGGGAIAEIGGHRDAGYVAPYIFWCKITLTVEVYLYIKLVAYAAFGSICESLNIRIVADALYSYWLFFVIASGLIVVLIGIRAYLNERVLARFDMNRFYVSELGGYLPRSYEYHINMARQSKSRLVLEEYWGLWSAVKRVHSILPVDSVIHALGDTRDASSLAIKNNAPDVVVTTARSMSVDWQPWSLSSNYWFYKPILQQYTPEQTSPTTIVWKKTRPVIWGSVKCEVNNEGAPYFALPGGGAGLYEIRLSMSKLLHDSRGLLFIKNNISQVTDRDGYISLNTEKGFYEFPVAIIKSRPKVFDVKAIPSRLKKNDGIIHLNTCEARQIVFDNIEVFSTNNFGVERTAYNYTDVDFLNGIGRRIPTFFVSNTSENEEEYKVGKKVKFSNGEIRQIVNRSIENRIFILFDGSPLDGNIVGFPNMIEILK